MGSGRLGAPDAVLHNWQSGDTFGRILDILALHGRIPHNSLSRKDVSSGPRPRCLARSQLRCHSVAGDASSHLRGRRDSTAEPASPVS